jgi:hypothetical protein
MEAALIARLLGTAGVAALIGGTRVYPGSRPQGDQLPAIVLNWISGAPVYTDDGEAGLASVRVQIDCWGETYSSAKDVAQAVRASLSAFQGTISGVTFQNILIEDERDDREDGLNDAQYLYRTNIDFIIWYES